MAFIAIGEAGSAVGGKEMTREIVDLVDRCDSPGSRNTMILRIDNGNRLIFIYNRNIMN